MLIALLVVLSVAPVRVAQVSPVNHEGAPTECVAARCGFALMADGRLFSARSGGFVFFEKDLSIRAKRDGPVVFARERSGRLVGAGPNRSGNAVQVLFCSLNDSVLRCHHAFDPTKKDEVWNETNCAAAFEARVNGGSIEATFPAFPDAKPHVVAKVEGDAMTVLFLYALRAIEWDTEHHTPFVDDVQSPR